MVDSDKASQKKEQSASPNPENKVTEASDLLTWILSVISSIQTFLLTLAGKFSAFMHLMPFLQKFGNVLTGVWNPLDTAFSVFYLAASIYLFKTRPTSRGKRWFDLIFAVTASLTGIALVAVTFTAVALAPALFAVSAGLIFINRAYVFLRNLVKCHPSVLAWDREKTQKSLIAALTKLHGKYSNLDINEEAFLKTLSTSIEDTTVEEKKLLIRLRQVTLQKIALRTLPEQRDVGQKTLVTTMLAYQQKKLANTALNSFIAGAYAAGFIAFCIPVVGQIIAPALLFLATATFITTKAAQFLYESFQDWRAKAARSTLGNNEDSLKTDYFQSSHLKTAEEKENFWNGLSPRMQKQALDTFAVKKAREKGFLSPNRGTQMMQWWVAALAPSQKIFSPRDFIGFIAKATLTFLATPFILGLAGVLGSVDKARDVIHSKRVSTEELERTAVQALRADPPSSTDTAPVAATAAPGSGQPSSCSRAAAGNIAPAADPADATAAPVSEPSSDLQAAAGIAPAADPAALSPAYTPRPQ